MATEPFGYRILLWLWYYLIWLILYRTWVVGRLWGTKYNLEMRNNQQNKTFYSALVPSAPSAGCF